MADPTAFDLDLAIGVPLDRLAHTPTRRWGKWQWRIWALNEMVLAGKAEPNTYYRLGQFPNRNGAYNVVRRYSQNPSSLPIEGTVDLEHRLVSAPDGTRWSELWAAIIE